MNTQCKVFTRGGDKTRSLVQRDSPAFSRRPGSATRNPIPAGRVQNEFTVEEHLLVQRRIEERAHRIWIANFYSPKTMLDDWLKAEGEVLAEFVESLLKCNPSAPEPENQQKYGKPSHLLPEIRHQQPNRLNQKSNPTIR